MDIATTTFPQWRQDTTSGVSGSITFDSNQVATIQAPSGFWVLHESIDGLRGGDTIEFEFYAKNETENGQFVRAHFDKTRFGNSLVRMEIHDSEWRLYKLKYTVPYGADFSRVVISLGIYSAPSGDYRAKFRSPSIRVIQRGGMGSRLWVGGLLELSGGTFTPNKNFPLRNIKRITKPESTRMRFDVEYEDSIEEESGGGDRLVSRPIVFAQLDDTQYFPMKYVVKVFAMRASQFSFSIVNVQTGDTMQTSEIESGKNLYVAITSHL